MYTIWHSNSIVWLDRYRGQWGSHGVREASKGDCRMWAGMDCESSCQKHLTPIDCYKPFCYCPLLVSSPHTLSLVWGAQAKFAMGMRGSGNLGVDGWMLVWSRANSCFGVGCVGPERAHQPSTAKWGMALGKSVYRVFYFRKTTVWALIIFHFTNGP